MDGAGGIAGGGAVDGRDALFSVGVSVGFGVGSGVGVRVS